ncbi:MAG: hypothetical protein A3B68_05495 [Candidatus Melainabacteria bacterium RIFCSPHIGHO2_02_FULL_34_12]|nr:MAG: hypothetical protein A3B68_05495 [Candidatus Melainabacteria bacterium RIFCSPHIGHO2_02_FULL_34_12]
MNKPELAAVMPVFNEEEIIAAVVSKWTKEFERLGINYKFHIYDASTDKTSDILNKIGNKNIIVHKRPRLGHGPDLVYGYRENSDSEWIFQIDSDDEMGTEGFESLWKNKEKFDLLLGRRNRKNQPFTRQIISFISRLVIKVFYGNKVYDVNSPYRLMKSSGFKTLYMKLPDDLCIPNIVISGYASLKNLRVFETEVSHSQRKTGTVSIQKMKLLKIAFKSFLQAITFRFSINN